MTRKEAIEIIRNYDINGCGYCHQGGNEIEEAFEMAIKALEQTRWIPVSERLPENKTYVLTTIHIPGRQPHARSGWYQDGFFHNDNGDVWNATDIEVQAWMPLPEPYRAEGSGEE